MTMTAVYWDSGELSWVAKFDDGYEVVLPADNQLEAELMLQQVLDEEGVLVDEC